MEKHFFARFRLHDPERIRNAGEVTEGSDSGIIARFTSFIMAWLLAIFFCLVFWYGVYLLLRSLLPKVSDGG